jgi:hypothetical protein
MNLVSDTIKRIHNLSSESRILAAKIEYDKLFKILETNQNSDTDLEQFEQLLSRYDEVVDALASDEGCDYPLCGEDKVFVKLF